MDADTNIHRERDTDGDRNADTNADLHALAYARCADGYATAYGNMDIKRDPVIHMDGDIQRHAIADMDVHAQRDLYGDDPTNTNAAADHVTANAHPRTDGDDHAVIHFNMDGFTNFDSNANSNR
jgi:hypothetical protein